MAVREKLEAQRKERKKERDAPFIPDCSSQESVYSSRGLFATGRSALGEGSSPLSLVSGRSLRNETRYEGKDKDSLVPKACDEDCEELLLLKRWLNGVDVHDEQEQEQDKIPHTTRARRLSPDHPTPP